MLTVRLPPGADAARRYAIDVLLGEFLGVAFRYGDACEAGAWRIEAGDRVLVMADVFLPAADAAWLVPGSLPDTSPQEWRYTDDLPALRLSGATLPCRFVAAGEPALLVFSESGAHCRIDLPGTVFCLLTRYEEAVCATRDMHGRFPLSALGTFQRENLHRPLADECAEVLFAILQRLWPGIGRRPRAFRMLASHDVDRPFEYLFMSPVRMALRAGADLLQRRDPSQAMDTWRSWRRVRGGDLAADPCNTFDWLMTESDRRGLRSAFYFICAGTGSALDGDYDFAHPAIRDLVRRIAQRGHEVGIHGSYRSAEDGAQLAHEAALLRGALAGLLPADGTLGGRQHFLRWRTPGSMADQDVAGLAYDATLGFAERPGFRCGTCREHPAFDLRGRRPLAVRERPLVAMDVSVTHPVYMGLGHGDAAFAIFAGLKQTCRRYDGDFTLLWHNSRLMTEEQRRFYTGVLDA